MNWTDEQVEKLKTLWREGKPASQIAEELGAGFTRNAIIGKVHRLGLSGRPSPIRSKTPRAPRITLLDLTERMCRWPIGDPRQPGFHFCGKPVQPGLVYCGEHAQVAYQSSARQRAEEAQRAAQRLLAAAPAAALPAPAANGEDSASPAAKPPAAEAERDLSKEPAAA